MRAVSTRGKVDQVLVNLIIDSKPLSTQDTNFDTNLNNALSSGTLKKPMTEPNPDPDIKVKRKLKNKNQIPTFRYGQTSSDDYKKNFFLKRNMRQV